MRKNSFNFRKKTKKESFSCYKEIRKRNKKKTRKNNNGSSLNCKNNKKHFFKSLSNNQPTDSATIFTQNAEWNALETFSYALDEDKDL